MYSPSRVGRDRKLHIKGALDLTIYVCSVSFSIFRFISNFNSSIQYNIHRKERKGNGNQYFCRPLIFDEPYWILCLAFYEVPYIAFY